MLQELTPAVALVSDEVRREPVSSPPLTVESLVDRYGPRLLGLARRICPNRADAEDLVQETFLQAHRKLSTFEGRSDPGTWLHTIAVRLCRRKFRARGARRMPALSDLLPFHDRGVADLGEAGSSPLDHAMDREAIEAVQAQIAAMPIAFRLPLVLKDVCELSVVDAASALGLKPQTLKTRVHRARLMLRRALLARLPQRPAPAPAYDRQVCLDLLAAKLDAMDRQREGRAGAAPFPIGGEVICERCRAVFAELDLTQAACARIAEGEFPEALRAAILGRDTPPRAGRRITRRARIVPAREPGKQIGPLTSTGGHHQTADYDHHHHHQNRARSGR